MLNVTKMLHGISEIHILMDRNNIDTYSFIKILVRKAVFLTLCFFCVSFFSAPVYADSLELVSAGAGKALAGSSSVLTIKDDEILGEAAGEAVAPKHQAAIATIEAIMHPVSDNSVSGNAGELSNDKILEQKKALAVVTGEAVDDGTIAGYTNLGIAKVDNWLNVRQGPSESEELVGKMPKHAGCEILEEKDGWAHIKSGKVEGWSNLEYLYTGEEAKTKAKEYIMLMATVTTTTLFVREEPSTESSVITMVPLEEELEVTEELEGWCKITIDDEEGYISKDYVTLAQKLERAVTMKELRYGQGVSDVRISMVNYAKQFLGNAYVWGGTSLTKGTDCSGFTMGIYRKFGIGLPRNSRAQASTGTKVTVSELRPGDLVFYGKGSYINHVAMYIGGGQVIHASSKKTGIKISNVAYRTPITCRRYIKD